MKGNQTKSNFVHYETRMDKEKIKDRKIEIEFMGIQLIRVVILGKKLFLVNWTFPVGEKKYKGILRPTYSFGSHNYVFLFIQVKSLVTREIPNLLNRLSCVGLT